MSSLVAAVEDLLILIIVALVPALLYLSWIRGSERYQTQPWSSLLNTFTYGAFGATIVAAILEVILISIGTAISQNYPRPEFLFLNGNSPLGLFFIVLVIAPFVEEGLKATGVYRAREQLKLVSDGLVFGAAAGLGFGFFETFIYGFSAFVTGGLVAGITLILVRSVSSVVLHGSTTSMFGYGYALDRLEGRSGATASYYLLAVLMHATFNFIASLGVIVAALGYGTNYSDLASLLALLLGIGFAFGAIEHARAVIRRTDFPGAAQVHPRFRPPPPVRRASTAPSDRR